MKVLKVATQPKSPQLNLALDPSLRLKLTAMDQKKITLVLGQILMQAAGLIVEEMADDGR